MRFVDLVVIGGGSAGLASAISAYDEGVKNIVIIEKNHELGGILNQCIHPGFGLETFKEELTGPEYAYRYIKEVEKRNIEVLLETFVMSINEKLEVRISNKSGAEIIKAKAIICALGCNERTFSQIMIPGDRPIGVYTAGLAQKYLNIKGYLVGKNVYILGSGDIGLIMARRMKLEGANVIGVSELMPYSNGLNRNIVQCLNDFDIPLRLSNTVTKIIGKNRLEAIEICDVDENLQHIEKTKQIIKCDTLLLSVGLYPYNGLLKNAGCKVNPYTKGASVDNYFETSISGIFSTGNGLHVHDLVDFVSEESCFVGKNVAKLILNLRKPVIKEIEVKMGENINYVLPNTIKITSVDENVVFYFRVNKKISKGKIIIKDQEKIIKKVVKTYLEPSEMIKLILPIRLFDSSDFVEVLVEEF